MDNKLEEISTLILVRNYIAMATQSNFRYIEKKDINELHSRLANVDKKIIKMILETI